MAYKLSAWAVIYPKAWVLQGLQEEIARDVTDVWDKSCQVKYDEPTWLTTLKSLHITFITSPTLTPEQIS